jgi:uncharacterized protein DUF4440
MSHLTALPESMKGAPLVDEPEAPIQAELLALKNAALRATAAGDVAFYADYLSEQALGVTPFGVFNKQQILQGMKDGRSFRSKSVDDEHAMALGADAGLVTYRATFESAEGQESVFFVSTLYRRFPDGWKGVFYQQTPLPAK